MITITALLKQLTEKLFSVRTSATERNSCFENIDAIVKNGSANAEPFLFSEYSLSEDCSNNEKQLQAIHGGLSTINYRLKSPDSRLTNNPFGQLVYQKLYAVPSNPKFFTAMRKNLSKKFFATVLTIVSLFFVNAALGQATVTTDQLDYPPGSTVFITGSGYTPGETVVLHVAHTPPEASDSTDPAHEPWNVIADANGNISSDWVIDADGLGATYLLTADGQSSLLHAETIFTDAANDLFSYASNCSTLKTSFCLGETVCVKATGTSGSNHIEWYNPSNVLSNRTPTTGDLSGDLTSSFAPTVAGTWTIKLVKSNSTLQNTITITVTAAPTIGSPGANTTIECTATPNFTAPTASDACSSVTVNELSTTTSGNSC